MVRHITLLFAFALMLLSAQPLLAKDKKKNPKSDVHPTLPVPDKLPARKKPQTGLSPVKEIARAKAPKRSFSNHRSSNRGGIDVSHYQGTINWKEVASDKSVLYAYLKASENTTLGDNTFEYNLREAKANGIPVGCYHFFSPTAPGDKQLQHFIETVDLKQQDLIPIVDIEIRGKASLSEFQRQIRIFLTGFEEHYGFKPIIYASVNFYNKYLSGAFDNYKYMIAKYSDDVPDPQGPIEFVMWQYSSRGHIDGIRGSVDQSCFMDSYDLDDIRIKQVK